MTDTTDTPTDEREGRSHAAGPETDRSIRDSATLERRDYLQSLGALGAAGLLGGLGLDTFGVEAIGSAAAQAREDWEAAADERIREHRTGDLEVVVRTEDGEPIPGADVRIEMREHEYRFGTMIHAEFLTRQSEWGEELYTEADQQRYRETVEELFNTVVLENLHKWLLWEENTEIADEAVEWARERDMDVRGHVCLWGNVDAWAIPPDVVEAMGVDWSDGHDDFEEPDHDPEYVYERSMAHIEEIISHYGDDITEWEVVNEVIHEPAMIEAIEGEDVDPVTAPVLGEWYEYAEEIADQYDAGIAVNDYNTLVGAYGDTRDDYERQIAYLVDDVGVDLDGIGFQCHFADHETLTPDEILEGIERFTGYAGGFRATEFDTFQGDWGSPEEQGAYLYQFLKTFFSHPETEAFLVWGHWDGVHWAPDFDGSDPDAPLFDEDWNPKPAYDYYTDLVFGEWWTDESGPADDDGRYETAAFLGEHEITVTTDAEATTTTVSVTDADGTTTVEVIADGTGGPERPDAPDSITVTGLTDSSVDLEWDPVPEAARYAVYVDGNRDGEVSGSERSATVDGLSAATRYEFGVAAVDGDGIESAVTTVFQTTGDPAYPEWDPDEVYDEGDRVVHDDAVWEAQWWTQNQEPGADEHGPWEEVEDADPDPEWDPDPDPDPDPNPEMPPEIDGYQPADTTGDGLYNDITGSGSTTTTDVTVFFENVENPAVADYPAYYDFDGNGQVTITDVVELFESL